MKTSHLALDLGVRLLAGLAATKVTEYAQQTLWAATRQPIWLARRTRARLQRPHRGFPAAAHLCRLTEARVRTPDL